LPYLIKFLNRYFFKKKNKDEDDSDSEENQTEEDNKIKSPNKRHTGTINKNLEIQSNPITSTNQVGSSNSEPINVKKNNFEITSHKPVEIKTQKETLKINNQNVEIIGTKPEKKYKMEDIQSEGYESNDEKERLKTIKSKINFLI
jgi:hypothetical protein